MRNWKAARSTPKSSCAAWASPPRGSRKSTTAEDALNALSGFDYPVVVKADGLAAGKGVMIAPDRTHGGIRHPDPRTAAGHRRIPDGEEVSFIVLSDGRDIVSFEATQDHKAVGDGDTGPNTGGMGAYCDGRILSDSESQRVLDTIIAPVIAATGFTGFLYAGLMMTSDGSQGAGVQRPPGRPGNPAVDAPHGLRLR